MDEFELLNWPWDWVPSYVVLWWADDLPWCSQSLLKAAWIGSSSGRWMDGSHFQESHKDMKMHLFDAMLYFTPLWGEPCLTNDTCVKVLIDVNTFLMSQSKMQNSRHTAQLKELIESPMCPTKRETLWSGTGARRASEVNHPVLIFLAIFSFTVSRMQQFGHLKWMS